jgi:hypothetical protein
LGFAEGGVAAINRWWITGTSNSNHSYRIAICRDFNSHVFSLYKGLRRPEEITKTRIAKRP